MLEENSERAMRNLIASTFAGSASLWLYLDNELIMQNSDSLTMELGEDEGYIVHWFVSGMPGSSYSITISSPKGAQFQLTKAIDKTGKDSGGFQFRQ
jgi:hypothetical protein